MRKLWNKYFDWVATIESDSLARLVLMGTICGGVAAMGLVLWLMVWVVGVQGLACLLDVVMAGVLLYAISGVILDEIRGIRW